MLLAGLCQLTLLPIGIEDTETSSTSSTDIRMNNEFEYHYERLKNEQIEFQNKLNEFISTHQDSLKRNFEIIMTDLLLEVQ